MNPHLPSSEIRHHRPGVQALYDLPDMSEPKKAKRRANWYVRVALILIAVLLAFTVRTAWATEYEAQEDEQSDTHWGLGLGVGAIQKAYRDIDSDTLVLPIIAYDSKWFSVHGGTLGLKLPSAGPVSFALTADYSKDGYEASDSEFLRGMDERKDSFWVGATVKWKNDIADVSATWSCRRKQRRAEVLDLSRTRVRSR